MDPALGATVFTLYFAAMPITYYVILRLPKGWPRLIAMTPFLVAYTIIPRFIESLLLRTTQAMSWYTTLKLILLCYGRPLDPFHKLSGQSNPSIHTGQNDTPWHMSTFVHFCASVFLPVSLKNFCNKSKPLTSIASIFISIFCTAIPLAFFFHFCQQIPLNLRLPFTSILTYCGVQIQHSFFTLLFRFAFGVDLVPIFNKPWLSESVSEFWSKRWNLTVHALLKETIYSPLLQLLWRDGARNRACNLQEVRAKNLNEKMMKSRNSAKPPLSARLPAVFITFLVSGFIHEIGYLCITHCGRPTWMATLFFVLHGLVTCLEIVITRRAPMRFARPIKTCLTMGFVFVTASWLLLPPIVNARYYQDVAQEFQSIVCSILNQYQFKRTFDG